MRRSTPCRKTSTTPATILQFRQAIEDQFRRHIREALEVSLVEELAALVSARHERTQERRGYRHGTIERTVTTPDLALLMAFQQRHQAAARRFRWTFTRADLHQLLAKLAKTAEPERPAA